MLIVLRGKRIEAPVPVIYPVGLAALFRELKGDAEDVASVSRVVQQPARRGRRRCDAAEIALQDDPGAAVLVTGQLVAGGQCSASQQSGQVQLRRPCPPASRRFKAYARFSGEVAALPTKAGSRPPAAKKCLREAMDAVFGRLRPAGPLPSHRLFHALQLANTLLQRRVRGEELEDRPAPDLGNDVELVHGPAPACPQVPCRHLLHDAADLEERVDQVRGLAGDDRGAPVRRQFPVAREQPDQQQADDIDDNSDRQQQYEATGVAPVPAPGTYRRT